MKTVTKTYTKVLLMTAAVVVALALGFLLTEIIFTGLCLLARAQRDLAALIVWGVVSALLSAAGTYFVSWQLIRKCGFGKIKWLNILCSILTLLWCGLWSLAGMAVMEDLSEDDFGYTEYEVSMVEQSSQELGCA